MAIGDDAVAAGMSVVDGATTDANTIDTEINRSRDYIAQGKGATDAATANKVMKRDANGRAKVATPAVAADIATKGYVDGIGTSAATASAVVKRDANGRAQVATPAAAADIATKGYVDERDTTVQNWASGALLPKSDVVISTAASYANKVPRYDAAGRLAVVSPSGTDNVVNKAYCDANVSPFNGGTVTGQIYLPNAYAANVGTWVVAYINGDGRVAKGASSERYKERITPVEALALGHIFPDLYEFVMKGDPNHEVRIGHIAERLAEVPELRRFVVFQSEPALDEAGAVTGRVHLVLDDDGNPIPDSIDFISLLLCQTAQLAVRVAALEAER